MSYAAWAGVAIGVYSAWRQQQDAKAQRDAADADRDIYKSETAEGTRRFEIGEDWKRAEWERDQGQLEYGQELEQDRYGHAQEWQKVGWAQNQADKDANKAMLSPYTKAGAAASDEQMALLGLRGKKAGTEAMGRFSESPGQRFMRERAEKSLLRNASAIGGLRGGNVRSALVEQGVGFAAQDYDNQLRRLSSLSGRGLDAGKTLTVRGTGAGVEAPGALPRREVPGRVVAPVREVPPEPVDSGMGLISEEDKERLGRGENTTTIKYYG